MQSFHCQNGTLHPRLQTKQLAEGNDCIKITIRLDYWRKVPVIDERGTRRLASWHRKLLELSLDLLDHFPSNLALALNLNYEIATALPVLQLPLLPFRFIQGYPFHILSFIFSR